MVQTKTAARCLVQAVKQAVAVPAASLERKHLAGVVPAIRTILAPVAAVQVPARKKAAHKPLD